MKHPSIRLMMVWRPSLNLPDITKLFSTLQHHQMTLRGLLLQWRTWIIMMISRRGARLRNDASQETWRFRDLNYWRISTKVKIIFLSRSLRHLEINSLEKVSSTICLLSLVIKQARNNWRMLLIGATLINPQTLTNKVIQPYLSQLFHYPCHRWITLTAGAHKTFLQRNHFLQN